MATIVFRLPPSVSHYNFCLRLALQLNGLHDVYFLGTHNNSINIALNYYYLRYVNIHELQGDFAKQSYFDRLLTRVYSNNNVFSLYQRYRFAIQKVFDVIKPDYLFLDEQLKEEQIIFSKYVDKILLVNTQVRNRKVFKYPSKFSRQAPPQTLWGIILNELQWWDYYLRQCKKHLTYVCGAAICCEWKFAWHYAYVVTGRKLPELFLFPRSFEFPFTHQRNEFYLGYQVLPNRFEVTAEGRSVDVSVIDEIIKAKNGRRLVYLSFGTIPVLHYIDYKEIISQVVSYFANKDEYLLVVSDSGYYHGGYWPMFSNVLVYERVPQLDVLKMAYAIISHGGLNTILESIYNEVPLLLIPLNIYWDQYGNASRVEFHQLGVTFDIRRMSRPIETFINDFFKKHHVYKDSIRKFNQKALSSSDLEEFFEFTNLN